MQGGGIIIFGIRTIGYEFFDGIMKYEELI